MMVFVLMALVAGVFVVLAVRTSRDAKSHDSVEQAIAIHKDRLAALEQQLREKKLEPDDYRQFRTETERALLEDTRKQDRPRQYRPMPLSLAAALMVIIGGASFALYDRWGAADGVAVARSFQQLASSEQPTQAELQQALSGYQAMLDSRPDDLSGWFRLARMHMEVGQYEQAQPALEHVLTLLRRGERAAEDESTILAYLGQSLWAQGDAQAALTRFEQALEFNAQNTLALGFAGRLSFELGAYRESIDYWTRLKRLAGSGDTGMIDEFIARSKGALEEQGDSYEPEVMARIDVNVSLPAAWEGLPDSAALFVYARPVGGRMPLAVKRLPITGRGHRVTLTDADAMGPMGGLSGQDRVEVTARVSFKGTAETSPGDWTAEPITVDLNRRSGHSIDLDVIQP